MDDASISQTGKQPASPSGNQSVSHHARTSSCPWFPCPLVRFRSFLVRPCIVLVMSLCRVLVGMTRGEQD